MRSLSAPVPNRIENSAGALPSLKSRRKRRRDRRDKPRFGGRRFEALEPRVLLAAQMVDVSLSTNPLTPNQNATITLDIEADDDANGTTVRMHFNSAELSFQEARNEADAQFFQAGVEDDTNDLDGDPSTDQFVLISWLNFVGGDFPNPLSTKLVDIDVRTTASFDGATVRFTGNPPDGSTLSFTPAAVTLDLEQQQQTGSITGLVYNDEDGDGTRDGGEPALAGWTVFLDTNNNGTLNAGEPSDVTDGSGGYSFSDLSAGTYRVREVVQTGWTATAPAGGVHVVSLAAGEDETGLNFGNEQQVQTASISGTKYNDLDGDGTRDAGEPGLGGWTIFLDANNNGTLDGGEVSVLTNASGAYTFAGLDPEQHRVREVAQAGWTQTAPVSGVHVITLSGGQDATGVDFGNTEDAPEPGSISGIKYRDLDGDGARDAGEPGLSGWTIYLDANNNGVHDGGEASDVTDGGGNYSFADLAPGTHRVREVLQSPWVQTEPSNGVHVIALGSAQDVTGVNFGNELISTTGAISGIKYHDLDGDGNRDAGEPGLGGWTIYVDEDEDGVLDAGEPSAETTGTGTYSIGGLEPGTYEVREVQQAGWTQTAPASGVRTVTVFASQNIGGVDFGNQQDEPPNSISGVKFNDLDGDGVRDAGEPVLSGWTIYLDQDNDGVLDAGEPSVVTGGNGGYMFGDLADGTYRVREVSQAGWVQTAPGGGVHVLTLSGGVDVTDAHFGNQEMIETGSLSGVKFNDADGDGVRDAGEPVLSGWTIYLDEDNDGVLDAGEPSVVTDANGGYLFSDLEAGTYRVREVEQAGWVQTAPGTGMHMVVLGAGEDEAGLDFGNQAEAGSIDGTKFDDQDGDGVRDAGEPGLAGWTIFLDADSDGVQDAGEASVVTDANGSYLFTDVAPGTHRVREVLQAGWVQTAPASGVHVVTLTNGQSMTGVDFGSQAEPGSIGGVKYNDEDGDGVRDAGEPVLSAWTIYLDTNNNGVLDAGEPSDVTDGSGAYSFAGLAPGAYNVREVMQAGWTRTAPASGVHAVVLTAGQDATGRDFGNRFVPQLGSIGDMVFSDLNGNGVRDAGEPGIGGVTIDLIADDGDGVPDAGDAVVATTTTQANGFYEFGDVAEGRYFVDVTDGAGVLASATLTTPPEPRTLDLSAGEHASDADFGYEPPADARISGAVYNDLNSNGVRDAGEPGFAGVTIDLRLDLNGNGAIDPGDTVISTATTVGTGAYEFNDLAAGDYLADVTDTANVLDNFALRAGTDPAAVSLGASQQAAVAFTYEAVVSNEASIDDVVFNDLDEDGQRDAGEPGIAGVTVELFADANGNGVLDGADPLLETQMTAANGGFGFADLAAGSYLVHVEDETGVLAGFTLTAGANPLVVQLSEDEMFAGDGFGYADVELADASIGDLVFEDANRNGVRDAGEPGIADVTLSLWVDVNGDGAIDAGDNVLATRTADGQGLYDFTGLAPGDYIVEVTDTGNVLAGLELTAGVEPRAVTLSESEDFNGADFGYAEPDTGLELLPVTRGRVTFLDADGETVVVVLRGDGELRVQRQAGAQLADAHSIMVIGSSDRSALLVNVRGRGGTSVQTLSVDNGARLINARQLDVNAAVTLGGAARAVVLRDLNDAQMQIGGGVVRLQLDQADGSGIDIDGEARLVRMGNLSNGSLAIDGDNRVLRMGSLTDAQVTLGGEALSLVMDNVIDSNISIGGANRMLRMRQVSGATIMLGGEGGAIVGDEFMDSSVQVTGDARTLRLREVSGSQINLMGQAIVVNTGDVSNSTIQVGGDSRSLRLREVTDSQVQLHGDTGRVSTGNLTNASITVDGAARGLRLRDVTDAQIEVGGTPDARGGVSIIAGAVRDTSIQSGAVLRSLRVADWQNTDATRDQVTAPSAGGIFSRGGFMADVDLTDASARFSLRALSVRDMIADARITAMSDVRTISAAAIIDSTILVGLNTDGSGGPPAPGDFLQPARTLTNLLVRGSRGRNVAFANTDVMAGSIGFVRLRDVMTANGGEVFGVTANEEIRLVNIFRGPTSRNLDQPVVEQDQDFVIRVM